MFKFVGGVKHGKCLPVSYQLCEQGLYPMLPPLVEVPAQSAEEIEEAVSSSLPMGAISITKDTYTKREGETDKGKFTYYALKALSDEEALELFVMSGS